MLKRKLLLADDSITIQKVVNLTFADEGIEVISVGDGDSAMDRLREDLPDLVMADVNMPGLNGYEICEKIKQSGTDGQTPVILLVGSFEPFDEDEARRVGADDYLTKPFQSISQLVEKVSALLNPVNGNRLEEFEDTAEMPFVEPKIPSENNESNGLSKMPDEDIDEMSGQFDDEMIQTHQIGSVPVDDTIKMQSSPEVFDFAMDDEIIEEESFGYEVSGEDQTERSAADYQEDYPQSVDDSADDGFVDYNQTQPLTKADFQELTLVDESGREVEPETADEAAETEFQIVGEDDSEMSGSDSLVLSEDESDLSENDSFLADSAEEAGDGNAEEPESKFDETGDEPALEDTSELPMPEMASILELDEVNLLDLPPLEGTERDEQLGEQMSAEVTEQVRTVLSQELPVNRESGQTTGTDEGISPELVEIITQKVVDRLSDKAVREIAWEVVPELADLIIKKIAEEKMKD